MNKEFEEKLKMLESELKKETKRTKKLFLILFVGLVYLSVAVTLTVMWTNLEWWQAVILFLLYGAAHNANSLQQKNSQ